MCGGGGEGGGGGGSGGGGGGGNGGDDNGARWRRRRGTALPQASRVVAATRLDLYSAFALWARRKAGSVARAALPLQSLERRLKPPLQPADELERAEGMSFSSPPISARLRARPHAPVCESMVAQDHEGWKLPASACDDGAAAVAGSPRPHTAAAAAVMVSFKSPKRPLARVSCDSGDQNGSFFQNPGMRLQLG